MRIATGAFMAGFCLIRVLNAAPQFDPTKPPQTPAIPDIRIQNVNRFQLPNGLVVVAAQDNRFPLATIRLAFSAGLKYDPKDLPGLSEAVAELLNQGTATRSAKQIAEEAADLGGQISAETLPDTLTLSGSCLSANTARFLTLIADLARNASFPEDEVQLYKQNRLEKLHEEHSEPDYLGREALAAHLYAPHPYSHIGPTDTSLKLLDRKALENFRNAYIVPNNAALILVGQLPAPDELNKLIEDRFGSWQRKTVPEYTPPAMPVNRKQFVFVDRRGSVQANIYASHLTPTYQSADFFPLNISSRILGGGANSRLFMDIREKQGFAYDAHTETGFSKEVGAVNAVTEVRNEVAERALDALNTDLQAISKDTVPAAELSNAKASYAGRFILGLERQSGLAGLLVTVQMMGLPSDYLDTYMTHVRSVEPDQVRATGKYWDPDTATVVVVGDAQKIEKSLERFGTFQVEKAPQ
jgi:zinc protease